jgi:competence protein ComEA
MKVRVFLAVACATWVASIGPAAGAAQQSRTRGLPEGQGLDVLMRVCTDCHGTDAIEGQRRSRAAWKSVVDDMVARGANATDEDAEAVVNYLARYLGRVNVNRASEADMAAVLEIPAADAAAIAKYRTGGNEFKTFEDLAKVPGLDVSKLEGKKDRIGFSGQ